MIKVRPLLVCDLIEFCPLIREEDDTEVRAVTNNNILLQPLEALQDGYYIYHLPSMHPLGIGGIHPDGQVWMLLTTLINQHKVEFLKWSKGLLKDALEIYPCIWNITLKQNTLHIAWLQWLGAYIEDFSADSQFVKFTFRR